MKKALLIVDVQNDFCPGGALAVAEGDTVVPVLNKYIEVFSKANLSIFASRDWHPEKTKHFKDFGGTWPAHCIANTKGAEFHPDLLVSNNVIIISKGMDPDKDSYSAFQAFDEKGKNFTSILKNLAIEELYIGGLATDYCVKCSALDALKAGFKVKILTDAIKGVNINSTDSEEAVKEMLSKGANLTKISAT